MYKDETYLQHIRDAIWAVETYTDGLIYEEFLDDNLIQDGVVRQLGIIGEATKNLSSDFRNSHKEVPWRDMAGMRDKLIHGYNQVDLDIVWKTIQEDLPKLEEQIAKLLEE